MRYQPVDTLFCVRAQYIPVDSSKPLNGVTVRNYANRGAVNGPVVGTSGAGSGFPGRLVASVPNKNDPSKLSVGIAAPISNRPLFGGPYWVVAIAEDYSWAIVTGGAPRTATPEGLCFPKEGLWFFARSPVDVGATAQMQQRAEQLGLDTSVMVPVEQEGCSYEGAAVE